MKQYPFKQRARKFLVGCINQRKAAIKKGASKLDPNNSIDVVQKLENLMPDTTCGLARFIIKREEEIRFIMIGGQTKQQTRLDNLVEESINILQNIHV